MQEGRLEAIISNGSDVMRKFYPEVLLEIIGDNGYVEPMLRKPALEVTSTAGGELAKKCWA